MLGITKSIYCYIFLLLLFSHAAIYSQGYNIGDKAEDFELINIDGKMVSLAQFPEANGFIIIFTCNHCPYSKLYEDRIIALNKVFSAQGFPIIAINPNDPDIQPDDSFEKMIERSKEKNFEFPYLFDQNQEVFPVFGAQRTPHVFVLDKEKVVRYIGAIDDNPKSEVDVESHYLKDAIISLQMGEEPNPNFTKAVGCSIKKKDD